MKMREVEDNEKRETMREMPRGRNIYMVMLNETERKLTTHLPTYLLINLSALLTFLVMKKILDDINFDDFNKILFSRCVSFYLCSPI